MNRNDIYICFNKMFAKQIVSYADNKLNRKLNETLNFCRGEWKWIISSDILSILMRDPSQYIYFKLYPDKGKKYLLEIEIEEAPCKDNYLELVRKNEIDVQSLYPNKRQSKYYYEKPSNESFVVSARGCGKTLNMTMELNKNYIFNIKKVIFNDPATIVFWNDGTKTVVKAEGEKFDPEKGLAMAISKRALGNNGNYYDIFKKWLPKPTVQVTRREQCLKCKYRSMMDIYSPCSECIEGIKNGFVPRKGK